MLTVTYGRTEITSHVQPRGIALDAASKDCGTKELQVQLDVEETGIFARICVPTPCCDMNSKVPLSASTRLRKPAMPRPVLLRELARSLSTVPGPLSLTT